MFCARSLSFYGKGDEGRDAALKAALKSAPPSNPAPASPSGSMNGGSMNGPMESVIGDNSKADELESARLEGAREFYADLFAKQGGKLQLSLQGETSIAVYVFGSPRSFALLTRGPSRVIVACADGMPHLNAIGRVFSQIVGR